MVAPEEEDEASKTEDPSERKIEKAKEEGDTAVSQDAKSFIMFIGMLFVVWLILPLMLKWFYQYALKFIENPESIPTDQMHFQRLLISSGLALLKIMAIPFAVFMIFGIIASISQTGFIYAPKKLEPNWNKLNIFAALPNFINMKKVVESLKGIIKISVITFVAILVVRPYLEKVNLMPSMGTIAILSFIHKIVLLLIFTVVIAVFIIAVADYVYQRYTHLKKLRMTKQEVKDEYKNQEGDPQIKGKQRQRMQEASRRRMMQQLPEADVVITNPTHYAVAIKYDPDKYDAPYVIAKGEDFLAQKIKDVAKENHIEIVENKPLARMLYANVEIGGLVPPELYQAVAEVLAFVYHLKGKVS